MLAVDGVVELAHVVVGNLSCKFVQRLSHLGVMSQHLLANDGHGFVGREVVLVVFEDEEIESRDQAIGCVACGEVDLLVFERAGEQTEVHDARRLGEAQAVSRRQSLVTVRAFHEFVAEAGAPFRGVGGRLRDGLQAEAAGIFTANLYGEGVVESECLAYFQIELPRVLGFDLLINLFGIAGRLLLQDRGEGGAGVFRINIDAAAENGLLADVAAGEVEAAFYRKMGFVFDLLGDDFTEDELFGEILGSDDDAVGARGPAGARAARQRARARIVRARCMGPSLRSG